MPIHCKQLILILVLLCSCQLSLADNTLRIGILKFGTVNWELDVIKNWQLDKQAKITIEIIPYASKQATLVAFQSGTVDIIVADWIWVSRQRHEDNNFTFIPYSCALGAIMVPQASPIKDIPDLMNKRLGVAGGALDKSWLMLRSYTQALHNFDMLTELSPQYAAPPLLNGQIMHNKIDAVLNFWHYSARLQAQGYRRIHSMQDTITSLLGYQVQLPMLGYVFNRTHAEHNISLYQGFADAIQNARQIMLTDNQEWQRLRPLMKVADDDTFNLLREGYRKGIPTKWSALERASASIIYSILADTGGKKLVGDHTQLAPGTFWEHVTF